ncbi:MAG: beta-lactamase hydrolase domain-containing protein [Luteimonas sp.]
MRSRHTRTTARTLSLAWPIAGALFLAGCASMEPPDGNAGAAAPAAAADETPVRMVAEDLFTAGQPTPSQWASIRARGVTTIINLRPDEEMAGRDEAAEVASAGMTYRQLDVTGIHDVTDTNAAWVQAWIDEAPGPVLLHCASGNRAGALLAMIAARSGTPPEEALELGRRAGMTSLENAVRQLLVADAAKTR